MSQTRPSCGVTHQRTLVREHVDDKRVESLLHVDAAYDAASRVAPFPPASIPQSPPYSCILNQCCLDRSTSATWPAPVKRFCKHTLAKSHWSRTQVSLPCTVLKGGAPGCSSRYVWHSGGLPPRSPTYRSPRVGRSQPGFAWQRVRALGSAMRPIWCVAPEFPPVLPFAELAVWLRRSRSLAGCRAERDPL
jgi:hypothetical protein